ncbi:hypothetical protein [Escherichia phage vB_EcoM_JNE01]|nr:hypothetical protein [Escherichia phage vB_EcoM_JNE01]
MYETFVKYYNLGTPITKNINLQHCTHSAVHDHDPYRYILALLSI